MMMSASPYSCSLIDVNETGIPDYRSPGRPPHRPIQYQAFMGAHATRQRYWARSMFGFRHILRAAPNHGHMALAHAQNKIHYLITQVSLLPQTHIVRT
jgi:NAD-dependent SIR2 family protein deacetylase